MALSPSVVRAGPDAFQSGLWWAVRGPERFRGVAPSVPGDPRDRRSSPAYRRQPSVVGSDAISRGGRVPRRRSSSRGAGTGRGRRPRCPPPHGWRSPPRRGWSVGVPPRGPDIWTSHERSMVMYHHTADSTVCPDGQQAMVGQDDGLGVAEGGGEPLALLGIGRRRRCSRRRRHGPRRTRTRPGSAAPGADRAWTGPDPTSNGTVRRGDDVRPGGVDTRMDGEGGPVHRPLAFDDLTGVIDQDQVRGADLSEAHSEGIDPEVVGPARGRGQ